MTLLYRICAVIVLLWLGMALQWVAMIHVGAVVITVQVPDDDRICLECVAGPCGLALDQVRGEL